MLNAFNYTRFVMTFCMDMRHPFHVPYAFWYKCILCETRNKVETDRFQYVLNKTLRPNDYLIHMYTVSIEKLMHLVGRTEDIQ